MLFALPDVENPMLVRDVMTHEPYVARVQDTIRNVLLKLTEADIRHLPIVDDGRNLVGIVSDRDLRGILPAALESGDISAQRMLPQPISALMNTDVLSIDAESDLSDAIDLMIEHRVGAIPVVELGTSRLIGIVSYVDVLRAARDLF